MKSRNFKLVWFDDTPAEAFDVPSHAHIADSGVTQVLDQYDLGDGWTRYCITYPPSTDLRASFSDIFRYEVRPNYNCYRL